MEQRYQAVMAVIQDGWKVTEVAERLRVARQSVHNRIARYEAGRLPALAGRSHDPSSCSRQISPELEWTGTHPPRRVWRAYPPSAVGVAPSAALTTA
ncbi:MAG: helix-turn-helix domain-containing protein [Actinomycetota bacterium]